MNEFNIYAITPDPEDPSVTHMRYVDLEAFSNEFFPVGSIEVTPVGEGE